MESNAIALGADTVEPWREKQTRLPEFFFLGHKNLVYRPDWSFVETDVFRTELHAQICRLR